MQSSNPSLPGVALSLLLGLGALTASTFTDAAAPPTPPRPLAQQEFWASYDKKDWGACLCKSPQEPEVDIDAMLDRLI